MFIGSSPTVVTISDDGSYAYVGLSGTPQVQRYDTTKGTLDILFPFGPSQPTAPLSLASVYPLASSPGSIIAEVGEYTDDWEFQNWVVFDNGVARPNQVSPPDITTFPRYDLGGPLIPSGSDSLWFAPVLGFGSMQYVCENDAGVFIANSLPYPGGSQTPEAFGSGELASPEGDVFDAKSMTRLGSYGVPAYSGEHVIDEGLGHVIFLVAVYNAQGILAVTRF